jgi:hypothetical protein
MLSPKITRISLTHEVREDTNTSPSSTDSGQNPGILANLTAIQPDSLSTSKEKVLHKIFTNNKRTTETMKGTIN